MFKKYAKLKYYYIIYVLLFNYYKTEKKNKQFSEERNLLAKKNKQTKRTKCFLKKENFVSLKKKNDGFERRPQKTRYLFSLFQL